MEHLKTYDQNVANYWAWYKSKSENALSRFIKNLPSEDTTLIILKGHLLIEESLNELFQRLLKLPAAIEDARLSFFQKVCIAQAILDDIEGHRSFWKSIKHLNKIRNKYAHKVTPENIQDELIIFIKIVLEAAGKDAPEINNQLKVVGIEKLLSFCITSLFLGVRALIDGLDAAKLFPKTDNNS